MYGYLSYLLSIEKRGELTTAFSNAVVIASELSCGDGKKIAVVNHFLKLEIFITKK